MLALPTDANDDAVWDTRLVSQLDALDNKDVLSAHYQLISWAYEQASCCSPDSAAFAAKFTCVMKHFATTRPYVLYQFESLAHLQRFACFDPLAEWWIQVGGVIDARSFLPKMVRDHRCKSVYTYVLQHWHTGARSTDPSSSLFCIAVEAGNAEMLEALFDWGATMPNNIQHYCLALIYFMVSADPARMLALLDRRGLLLDIDDVYDEAVQRFRFFFWNRRDDEWRAKWIATLLAHQVELMPPRHAATGTSDEVGRLMQAALDAKALFRRAYLLRLVRD